jgi:hypothetical protein
MKFFGKAVEKVTAMAPLVPSQKVSSTKSEYEQKLGRLKKILKYLNEVVYWIMGPPRPPRIFVKGGDALVAGRAEAAAKEEAARKAAEERVILDEFGNQMKDRVVTSWDGLPNGTHEFSGLKEELVQLLTTLEGVTKEANDALKGQLGVSRSEQVQKIAEILKRAGEAQRRATPVLGERIESHSDRFGWSRMLATLAGHQATLQAQITAMDPAASSPFYLQARTAQVE